MITSSKVKPRALRFIVRARGRNGLRRSTSRHRCAIRRRRAAGGCGHRWNRHPEGTRSRPAPAPWPAARRLRTAPAAVAALHPRAGWRLPSGVAPVR
ncbi:hypothetical protein G6F24_018100 [Rhizopus arrhizus]|nr:hypothetical protein G6F24_018100 [Rhizopus arrhizus]